MKTNIKIYTAPWCAFCSKMKDEFNKRGLVYQELNIDILSAKDLEFFDELELKTIPQVFFDDVLVGGYEDTMKKFAEDAQEVQTAAPVSDEAGMSNREIIMVPKIQDSMALAITKLQTVCHGLAVEGGWWERKGDSLAAHNLLMTGTVTDEATLAILTSVANQERNPLELIALMHSELSEGLEGVRKDQMDDKLTHRKMIEVELADAIVRILDYAGGFNLDVGGALVEKLVFNITREDHQKENRLADGGKKY